MVPSILSTHGFLYSPAILRRITFQLPLCLNEVHQLLGLVDLECLDIKVTSRVGFT
jgi:hypothetical protein